MKSLKLSIVLPCHNEERFIERLVTSILKSLKRDVHELIIVNDRSTDKTKEIVDKLAHKYKKVKVLHRLKKTKKFEVEVGLALKEGYSLATGNQILSIDSDFAMLPKDIKKVVGEFKKGNWDMAIGSRFCIGSKLIGYSKEKLIANRAFHFLFCSLLGIKINDLTNNFKIFNKQLIQDIRFKEKGFAFNAETGLLPAIRGYRIKEVPVDWVKQLNDKSDFKVLNVAIPYLRVGLSALAEKYLHGQTMSSVERKKVIKSYFPELSTEEKILLRLLERNAVSETSGVDMQKDKTLKSLLKAGIVEETGEGKLYLSDVGHKMAKGAKDIYRE